MRRVIGYCRQSVAKHGETSETSLSLESQEQRIRQWASENMLPVAHVYRDHDLKGEDATRPALREAINAVGDDDVFAVYDLSRLARDNVLQETVYREIAARGGILISVTEPHAGDDLFRGLMGVINQQFRKQLSVRLRAADAANAARGKFKSRAPVGYVKREGKLYIDEQWAPVIREVFQRVINQDTYHEIARDIHDKHPDFPIVISHKAIKNIVNKWTYSGAVPHNGVPIWNDGKPWHEPIVPREVQERAIEESSRRILKFVRAKDYVSPLSGKTVHECGRPAYHRYSESTSSRNSMMCAGMSSVPRCDIGRPGISEPKLLLYVAELLGKDLSTLPDTVNGAVDLATSNYESQVPGNQQRVAAAEKKIAALRARRERAIQVHLDGLKDRPWMLEETASIDAQIKEHEEEIAKMPKPLDPDAVRALAESAVNHRDHINALSTEQAASLLGALGVVQFGPSGITIKYKEPYSYLFPNPTVIVWPTYNRAPKGKNVAAR